MADNPIYDENNVVLYDDQGNKVNVVLDDGVYRLAVSLGSSLSFQLAANTPIFNFDSAGTAITTSWTTLLNVTSKAGKLDFVACAAGTSNYQIRLTIDSIVIFTIAMSDLNNIGLANATNVEIWAETANKNFRYHPNAPVDFTDNVKVEAATTTGSDTLKWITIHREQQ